MFQKYSIVFMPTESVLLEIKKMKLDLAEKIGWFNSKNALAHITICEFQATEVDFMKILLDIEEICKYLHPSRIKLNHFDSFVSNGAFYISPDEDGKETLLQLMKSINQDLNIKAKKVSATPHMSIARKLSPEKLEIAERLFNTINIEFNCKSVFVRHFDSEKKQYDVTNEIVFKSETRPKSGQQTLFE